MSELPFEISARHKYNSKSNWKRYGMKFTNEEFLEIYNRYIHASHCEFCKKAFKNTKDRQLDHNHDTGEIRNILCNSCNGRKKDRVNNKKNASGYKYIYKDPDPKAVKGFYWRFSLTINGKYRKLKSSVDINKVIAFRDQYFLEHPNHYT